MRALAWVPKEIWQRKHQGWPRHGSDQRLMLHISLLQILVALRSWKTMRKKLENKIILRLRNVQVPAILNYTPWFLKPLSVTGAKPKFFRSEVPIQKVERHQAMETYSVLTVLRIVLRLQKEPTRFPPTPSIKSWKKNNKSWRRCLREPRRK